MSYSLFRESPVVDKLKGERILGVKGQECRGDGEERRKTRRKKNLGGERGRNSYWGESTGG